MTVSDAELEQVLDQTYPTWGEGLTRTAYGQWNRAQARTAWGRGRLRRLRLSETEGPVATAKAYELDATLDGRVIKVLGIGAVFTRPDARGRGHARALIEAMVADAADRGASAALLFSEIGPSPYERMGFSPIARMRAEIDVIPGRGIPATLMRSGEEKDLPAIAAIAARYAATARFALVRDIDHFQFFLSRMRLRAGLGPPGLREVEFFVTEEAYKAVSWVVCTRGPEGSTIVDAGDLDPTGARVGAMLQTLVARDPDRTPARLPAWLPPGFAAPQVRIAGHAMLEPVMMMRHLAGPNAAAALTPANVSYPDLDVF